MGRKLVVDNADKILKRFKRLVKENPKAWIPFPMEIFIVRKEEK